MVTQMREMRNLVKGAQPGDHFTFNCSSIPPLPFFLQSQCEFLVAVSGHGDQVGDTNGDEQDELDEGKSHIHRKWLRVLTANLVVYPSDICNPFTEQVQNYILDDVSIMSEFLSIFLSEHPVQDIFEILVSSLPERTQMTVCLQFSSIFQYILKTIRSDGF